MSIQLVLVFIRCLGTIDVSRASIHFSLRSILHLSVVSVSMYWGQQLYRFEILGLDFIVSRQLRRYTKVQHTAKNNFPGNSDFKCTTIPWSPSSDSFWFSRRRCSLQLLVPMHLVADGATCWHTLARCQRCMSVRTLSSMMCRSWLCSCTVLKINLKLV